ncbi:MAG TPA: hypothetical protein VGX28_03590 [Frankiaceae bacterium]|nr:hypothetical protein [Frankiaceae bacterium]
MKHLLLAAVAAALVAPAATAATGSCLDLADPAGDLAVWDAPAPTVPAGTELDALDLVGVRLEATTGDAVTATFSLAGAPAPRPGMRFRYKVVFHDDAYDYVLFAEVDNVVRMPFGGPYGIDVSPRGSDQSWSHSVSGSIDATARTVTVAAFGSSVPVLTLDPGHDFTVDSVQTFGGVGATYGHWDMVTGPHTLVVGDGCP